ncbi:RNA-dependent RNA polymerase [Erysiphe necator associated ambiguivirus 2]|nr:RNA-dependent RNA polymerase [Erysiphe necator associated ambiguivirus 2]
MDSFGVAGVPGLYAPAVHSCCYHNERVAFLKRSLGPTPVSAEEARGPVLASFGWLRRVAFRYGGTRWDLRDTAQSYTGALRSKYLQAEESLRLDGPLRSSDYKLSAFLKAEKIKPEAGFPKPRIIYPRSARYNLVLASWLKPFEHWLWGNLKSERSWGVRPSRVVAKGLNQVQRANLVDRKMRAVGEGCVVFEVDGAAFEAHTDLWQLLGEQSVYSAAYPGDSALRRVLSVQHQLSGRTSLGHRFWRGGGRASGDFNTGMGNTIVMLAVCRAVMLSFNCRFDLLVDGDNALVFVDSVSAPVVHAEFHRLALLHSGHEMVLERPVTELPDVVLGRSQPVFNGRHWSFVRPWERCISNGMASHVHLRGSRASALRFLGGVGRCEASLSVGIPVLGAWSHRLSLLGRPKSLVGLRDYQVLGVDVGSAVARDPVYIEPSAEARASFYRTFRLSPGAQVLLERRLAGWEPGEDDTYHRSPLPWSLFSADPGLLQSDDVCLVDGH